MTDSEMLKAIYNEMQVMKTELRSEMQEMKAELRSEMQDMKTELQSEMRQMESGLRSDMQKMNTNLQNQITDIKLTLENEVSRNIKIIAEGHQDLSRKLDEAIKINNENELMKIRLNILENDMRRVKNQIA